MTRKTPLVVVIAVKMHWEHPDCITVDHQSLEDKTVTLRDRDSMEQERVAIADLATLLDAKLNVKHWLQKI